MGLGFPPKTDTVGMDRDTEGADEAGGGAEVGVVGAVGEPLRRAPQFWQKLAPGVTLAPQVGQKLTAPVTTTGVVRFGGLAADTSVAVVSLTEAEAASDAAAASHLSEAAALAFAFAFFASILKRSFSCSSSILSRSLFSMKLSFVSRS